jgi:hypothetical protein
LKKPHLLRCPQSLHLDVHTSTPRRIDFRAPHNYSFLNGL